MHRLGLRVVRIVGVAVVAALASGRAQEPAAPSACAACHDQAQKMPGTAHAGLSCQTCHPQHEEFPHPAGIPKPTCGGCHQDVAARNRLGVHGLARAAGNQAAPDCQVCHGDAHQIRNPGTEAFRKTIPEICGTCHSQEFADYRTSVHGKAAAQGIVAAPVCSTCHGEHQIQPPSSSASPVNPAHIPQTCGHCHGNVQLTQRFNLPRDTLVSFEASYHGLALKAGSETVANCASCHGVHNILPPSDPSSTINPKNLPHTCGKCHPGAGTRFAISRMHWVEGQSEPRSVRWVRLAYGFLIPLVIGLMLLHNVGDWTRKIIRLRLRPSRGPTPAVTATIAAEGPASLSLRMFRFERIEHGVLILCFTTLVWSGFALRYPDQWWARPLVAWEAHWHVRGFIHRVAGAILIAVSVLHAASLFVNRKLRRHWTSLWPQRRDVAEGVGRFAYSLGLRDQRPAISSHSYIEKAEYWAVVWGTALMACTGVVLWANTLVLTWLPKVTLDVATAIHFYEAVLATLAILVWHFYFVILDPEVYPMDAAWLTGFSVRKREAGEPAEEGTDAVEGADDAQHGRAPPP